MARYRVTVDLTHPEDVKAFSAVLEDNGALTFRDGDGCFISTYAHGVWRKVEVINEPAPQPS